MAVRDMLLNEENDLNIADGDLVLGESTRQHQTLLLLTDKGEWKQYPTVGVGISRYLEDYRSDALARSIRGELNKDGMNVDRIAINGDKIEIEAAY